MFLYICWKQTMCRLFLCCHSSQCLFDVGVVTSVLSSPQTFCSSSRRIETRFVNGRHQALSSPVPHTYSFRFVSMLTLAPDCVADWSVSQEEVRKMKNRIWCQRYYEKLKLDPERYARRKQAMRDVKRRAYLRKKLQVQEKQ